MTLEVLCPSPDDTMALGRALGRVVRPGAVIALQGPLGAGKTLFTKGVAQGLDVPGWQYVTSPTFAIHNVYRGRLKLHHLDLYRLGSSGELEDLGLDDALYGSDVCVLEWPDLFFEDLPRDRVQVQFSWGSSDSRLLRFEARGSESRALIEDLREALRGTGRGREHHDL